MDSSGALMGSIDVAQVVLYVFWVFFAGLILYLRKEDKREGYPLVSDRSDHVLVQGFPAMPAPKVFALADGGHYSAPHDESDARPIAARPIASFPGAPLAPTGDGMAAGVGPGSVAIRPDRPETLVSGQPRVRPLAFARDFDVAPGSPDPRGMTVFGADGVSAGRVSDLWVDLAESALRYLEVEIGDLPGARRLLPVALCKVDPGARAIRVAAIRGSQLSGVPALADAQVVTMMEEERITAYYGAGTLYAMPGRQEPIV
ncbi:MAG: photosynthetic reaction center subunit H [Myxococcota bacterium]